MPNNRRGRMGWARDFKYNQSGWFTTEDARAASLTDKDMAELTRQSGAVPEIVIPFGRATPAVFSLRVMAEVT
jgi:hypothetical protein